MNVDEQVHECAIYLASTLTHPQDWRWRKYECLCKYLTEKKLQDESRFFQFNKIEIQDL
jgi:hypothetical protein